MSIFLHLKVDIIYYSFQGGKYFNIFADLLNQSMLWSSSFLVHIKHHLRSIACLYLRHKNLQDISRCVNEKYVWSDLWCFILSRKIILRKIFLLKINSSHESCQWFLSLTTNEVTGSNVKCLTLFDWFEASTFMNRFRSLIRWIWWMQSFWRTDINIGWLKFECHNYININNKINKTLCNVT